MDLKALMLSWVGRSIYLTVYFDFEVQRKV